MHCEAISESLNTYCIILFHVHVEDYDVQDFAVALRGLANHETWKSAPKRHVLVRYASLFAGLFRVAPNGIMLSTMLASAIVLASKELLASTMLCTSLALTVLLCEALSLSAIIQT